MIKMILKELLMKLGMDGFLLLENNIKNYTEDNEKIHMY